MHRRCGRAAIRMAELLVRASLPGLLETERAENGDDFARLENGTGGHSRSGNDNDLRADELTFRPRGTVFEEHGEDFMKIVLAARFRQARNIADIKTRVPAAFDNGDVSANR